MSPSHVTATITISNGVCTIDDKTLEEIKKYAEEKIQKSFDLSYSEFPINKEQMEKLVIGQMFTKDNICQIFKQPLGVSQENHNKVRTEYTSKGISRNDAMERGVIADRLKIEEECPNDYNWRSSKYYVNAEKCEDVTKFFSPGLPTIMFGVDLNATQANGYLSNPRAAPFHTRYANSGPTSCIGENGEHDLFYSLYSSPAIRLFWSSTDFILHFNGGEGWSGWSIRRHCVGEDNGQKKYYSPDDLLFSFGMRIFVPIEVVRDGKSATATLILMQQAAASGKINPPANTVFEQLIGREYAKKLFLEALGRGWEVKR